MHACPSPASTQWSPNAPRAERIPAGHHGQPFTGLSHSPHPPARERLYDALCDAFLSPHWHRLEARLRRAAGSAARSDFGLHQRDQG